MRNLLSLPVASLLISVIPLQANQVTLGEFNDIRVENVTLTDELQVTDNAYVDGAIFLGGTNPIKIDKKTAIYSGAYLGHTTPWNSLQLFDPYIRNILASADKRFSVSFASGSFTDPSFGRLFNGRVEGDGGKNKLSDGGRATLRIDFRKGGQFPHGITYARGALFVSSYYRGKFEVTGGRIVDKDGVVHEFDPSFIQSVSVPNGYVDTLWRIDIPQVYQGATYLYATSIEIDLLGKEPGSFASIAEVEYYLNSPLHGYGALVSKYSPESLYQKLSFHDDAGNKTIELDPETGVISADAIILTSPSGDVSMGVFTN